MLLVCLTGCEVQTLYGVEIVDAPEEESWNVVRKADYTLYLEGVNHPDSPGVYLIAQSNDRADPPWSWEDYQEWPEAEQAARFGEYFDQRYLDVTVTGISRCSFEVETFDHRDGAREMAYGRWLNNMTSVRIVDDLVKGIFVRIPVAQCEKRSSGQGGREVELMVIVGDREEVTITIRVEFVDAWFDWWFL